MGRRLPSPAGSTAVSPRRASSSRFTAKGSSCAKTWTPFPVTTVPAPLSLGVVAYLQYENPKHRFTRVNDVLSAFERKSCAFDGSSRFFNLHPGHDVTSSTLDEIKESRPDGLLFIPPFLERFEDNIRKLLTLGLPVVAGAQTKLTHHVLHDHQQAAATITSYLFSLGLSKLAFLQRRNSYYWARERLDGFKSAGGGRFVQLDVRADDEGIKAEFKSLLPKLLAWGVQGVLCSGDLYAVELLEQARRQGVRVPEDLAIAGMDDDSQCRPWNLTTVQLSNYELGEAGYDLLSEIIARPPEGVVGRRLHCPLLVRDTTPLSLQRNNRKVLANELVLR